MSASSSSQGQHHQQDPDERPGAARVGAWLFKKRTLVPLPVVVALLVLPPHTRHPLVPWVGAALVAAGELLRVWAVRQIGVISRTRSDRLGPLVDTGPFAGVRNPLYLGNIAIWLGFAFSARLPWFALVAFAFLGITYHAIVQWEERLLELRLGQDYRAYTRRVPRWWPRPLQGVRARRETHETFSWRDTIFSERGTLIAIAGGYVLLGLKAAAAGWP